MSRCQIPADEAIFIAEGVEFKYAAQAAHASLKGINNCFQINCDYMERHGRFGDEIPFQVVGAISIIPSKMTEVEVPVPIQVKGVRIKGMTSFAVKSGNIGKYPVKNTQEIRINVRQADNALFFVKVWLPSQALLANKSAK